MGNSDEQPSELRRAAQENVRRHVPRLGYVLITAILLMGLMAACGGSTTDSAGEDVGGQESSPAAVGADDSEARNKDGQVTVDGTNFDFSFDTPGRCGLAAQDGSIAAQGFMLDDLNRQVAFLYSLADESADGTDWLQIVLYDENGQQLWYSKVGFGGEDVGSVASLSRNGDTVTATGQLSFAADGRLADFTAEATCEAET